ncbi:hypothetical protein Tco_1026565, partial [Tanacetum coccineum]
METHLLSNTMALWQSQMEDHTSDWLRVVSISGLGQTMNACSKVFTGDIYGDNVVSCAGIIGIKHRHNVVRDNLVDICIRSGISAGKEVDIGLGGGCDKPLRTADMLFYLWDGGLDVCVDLTGSSPLTQTGMVDFVPGRAVIDAAHQKDAVTLLKRIRKFSMTQGIGARAAVHIFNKISFAIAKGGGAQKVELFDLNALDVMNSFVTLNHLQAAVFFVCVVLVELKEAEQKSLKESERLEKEIADVQELK